MFARCTWWRRGRGGSSAWVGSESLVRAAPGPRATAVPCHIVPFPCCLVMCLPCAALHGCQRWPVTLRCLGAARAMPDAFPSRPTAPCPLLLPLCSPKSSLHPCPGASSGLPVRDGTGQLHPCTTEGCFCSSGSLRPPPQPTQKRASWHGPWVAPSAGDKIGRAW